MARCIRCNNGGDPFEASLTVSYHRLDGAVTEGPMCPRCYNRPEVGIHRRPPRDGALNMCFACRDMAVQDVYELRPRDSWTTTMPPGCPIHDEPEHALAFMLWWEKYRREHAEKVTSDA